MNILYVMEESWNCETSAIRSNTHYQSSHWNFIHWFWPFGYALFLTEGGRSVEVTGRGGQDVCLVESHLSAKQDAAGHWHAGEDGSDRDDLSFATPFLQLHFIPSMATMNKIEVMTIKFVVSAQNDFITGSLKVDGAVGIVDPVKQLIEKEKLWGQVRKLLCVFSKNPFGWLFNNLS